MFIDYREPVTSSRRGRLLAILLAAMFALSACGGSKENAGENKDGRSDAESDQQTAEEQQEDEMGDSQEAEPEEEYETTGDPGESLYADEEGITTAFYTLTLPESWYGAVLYHYYEDIEDGTSSLEVCEKQSAQAGAGGILFSVDLSTEYPKDLEMLPCDYMGTLVSEEGVTYYVVFRYPSDVQFDETTEERYTELYRQIPQIMELFSGAGAYTFERESSPG